jgi:hypothetical protein
MKQNILYFIFGLVFGFAVLFFFSELKKKCILGLVDNTLKKSIQKLIRQASRWSTAASQDENSMIALLHANYGAAYLWALRDIATSEQIKAAADIDILTFEKEITTIQDNITKNVIKNCPDFGPDATYLTTLGGEGT